MNSNEPRAIVELTYAQLLLLTEALNRMQTSALVNETTELVELAMDILDNEHDDNG